MGFEILMRALASGDPLVYLVLLGALTIIIAASVVIALLEEPFERWWTKPQRERLARESRMQEESSPQRPRSRKARPFDQERH